MVGFSILALINALLETIRCCHTGGGCSQTTVTSSKTYSDGTTEYSSRTSGLDCVSIEGGGTIKTASNTFEECPECPTPTDGGVGILPPKGSTEEVVSEEVEKIVLDSTFVNNPKAVCLLNMLLNEANFRDILKNLLPENSKFDVKFILTKDLRNLAGVKVDGLTRNSSPLQILIDLDIMNSASFPYIAEVMIHEAVHAKLYEMVKSVGGLSKLSEFSNEESEFGQLWAYYDKYGSQHGWQHELFFDSYVDQIAGGVENIHKLFPEDYIKFHQFMEGADGYIDPTDFYKKIVLKGLANTSKYPKLWDMRIKSFSNDLKSLSTAKKCPTN